jgi:hypothetical protein
MASFAQLDKNNVVINIISVADSDTINEKGVEDEEIGIKFCKNLLGQDTIWKKSSRNTFKGIYYTPNVYDENGAIADPDQSKSFRKNGAGKGHTYDSVRDAFIPPKPFVSWLLDETTCHWKAPVDMPTDDKMYTWNEETKFWDEIIV